MVCTHKDCIPHRKWKKKTSRRSDSYSMKSPFKLILEEHRMMVIVNSVKKTLVH